MGAALGFCSFCTAACLCVLRFVLEEAVTAEGAERSRWLDASPPAHPCTGYSRALQEGEDPACLFVPCDCVACRRDCICGQFLPSCPLLSSCLVFSSSGLCSLPVWTSLPSLRTSAVIAALLSAVQKTADPPPRCRWCLRQDPPLPSATVAAPLSPWTIPTFLP